VRAVGHIFRYSGNLSFSSYSRMCKHCCVRVCRRSLWTFWKTLYKAAHSRDKKGRSDTELNRMTVLELRRDRRL
jgi:hypothetical protein